MKAYVLTSHDGPRSLELREVPDPQPGEGEVLVAVRATALNRADLLQSLGRYPGPAMPYEIPGLELAGDVIALGPNADRFAVGAPVAGLTAGAAFAERIAIHQHLLFPMPDDLAYLEAAALPEATLTAFDALVRQAHLRSGERVLVHAGASGVGTAAIQIARELEARVSATCSPPKQERVRALGAECVVDSRSAGWTEELQSWAPRGIDVILDFIGAPTVPGDLALSAPRGRVVVLGLLGGTRTEIDLAELLTRRVSLIGSVLRSRSLEEKIDLMQHFERTLLLSIAAGRLLPVLDSTWSFDELPQALERLATNETTGKISIELE